MLIDDFWSCIDMSGGIDACWPWLFSLKNGYGNVWDGEKTLYCHREAWSRHNNKAIPKGCVVMHSCDNRKCCNPAHLSIGTQKKNLTDMVSRGRHKHPDTRGSKNPSSKLSESDVVAIRSDSRRQIDIAKKYDISQGCVSAIKRGKTWSCL